MFSGLIVTGLIIYSLIKGHSIKANRRKMNSHQKKSSSLMKQYSNELVRENATVSPELFLRMKEENQLKAFAGCYVIYNINKNKYYVGQSKNVIQRVANHLQGRGNGDVYVDLRNGDKFNISVLNIKDTNYKSLNPMEKFLIAKYNAYTNGYNKTIGNN